MSDGSGPNLRGSYASYDQSTALWRTYQGCLFEGWETFSETWPSSGTMRNGAVYPLPPWVLPISESGSSLWPTPDTQNHRDGTKVRNAEKQGRTPGTKWGMSLHHAVARWPTPTSRDWKDSMGTVPPSRRTPSKQTLGQRVAHLRVWPTPSGGTREGTVSGGHPGLGGGSGNRQKLYTMLGKEEGKKMCCQSLNPNWVEWLMGFPIGWTDLED